EGHLRIADSQPKKRRHDRIEAAEGATFGPEALTGARHHLPEPGVAATHDLQGPAGCELPVHSPPRSNPRVPEPHPVPRPGAAGPKVAPSAAARRAPLHIYCV